jgi:hypothetical protein
MSAERPKGFCARSISYLGLLLIMVKKIKPRLNVIYSPVYQRMILRLKKSEKKIDHKEMRSFARQLQKQWDKYNDQMFDTISQVTGLLWHRSIIDCYVINAVRPMSNPLTISRLHETNPIPSPRQIKIISHELIHNIFFQNPHMTDKKQLITSYAKETPLTQTHVLIHSIQQEVYRKIFGERGAKIVSQSPEADYLPDYQRAWDIVNKEGAKKIIKECIKK